MDGELVAELLNGPYGFLVAISIFLWLAAKEIRKARAEDVKAAHLAVSQAETNVLVEREKRIAAEAELRSNNEATNRKYWKARDMLITQYGVPPEDVP